ncbi:IS1 family transposase [Rosenbergiella gaditana]|uniref:IS1 family transposase n=1 Tax=Rosenbergiella gaditana TaxID=2726987 RepID=UPI003B830922
MLDLLTNTESYILNVFFYTTGLKPREVPKEKHLTGKIFIHLIECDNLSLRTRIKWLAHRTFCFPRLVEIHEKVIGAFIAKYMFYSLETAS